MLDAASAEALTRSLMLGTARHPAPVARAFDGVIAPDHPTAILKALALLGQRSRFARPAMIGSVAAMPLFSDERAIVPEAARPFLILLFSGNLAQSKDSIARVVADAIATKSLRLHPFDLPRLDDFVKAHSEQLGAGAIAWTERHASQTEVDPSGYTFIETIDETNWTLARSAQKAAFIRALRASDPARARELVERAMPGERAPNRVTLLKAMTDKLSPADGPFLENLAKDRAPTVREAAERLLARLPGSHQATKRLHDCLSRIKPVKSALPGQGAGIQLDYPATIKDWQREGWAVAMFEATGLDDLAHGLALSIDELITAAADDRILTTVLAVLGAAEKRYDLLARLVRGGAADAWIWMVRAEDSGAVDPPAIEAWSIAAIQPDLWQEMPDPASLASLYERIGGTLPAPAIEGLLRSKAWQSFLDAARQKEQPSAAATIAAITALTPPRQRQHLRADLETLAPNLTARAFAAMSLLQQIETA